MISAAGSMNRRISQGQAIRSVFGRARVIQFMTSSGMAGRWRGRVAGGEPGQVQVAAGHLVAGDRPVGDRPVYLAVSQRVAVRGGDPRVEHRVTGPHGDDHGVTARGGGFADKVGEDAVLRADRAAIGDPGQIPVPPLGRDGDGAQADNHGDSPGEAMTEVPAGVPGGRAGVREVRPRRRPQPHSVRSYPALTAPATTSGAPSAICCTTPAISGPMGRTVYREALVTAAAAVRSLGVTTVMTSAWRVGTSICDRVVRASSSSAANGNVGAKATAASSRLLGRWVPTMVATRPNRRASSGARPTETACTTETAKNSQPSAATETWYRSAEE